MNTSVLEVKGLEKKFKHFKLGPLNFSLEKGTAVALLGGNGSGKSTFFRLLMNILQKESGSITVFGEKMIENEAELKRRIGYTGDLFDPFSSHKVKDLAKLVSRWYPNWDHDRYSYFINRYNINENEKYGKCSKGTKKKVEFVFSICHNPDILLLDEPSANLDIVSQRKLKEDLIHYMEDGEKSIVLATHNMDDVRQICDYITIVEKGNILHSFEKDEIHDKWARLWVTELPNELKNHPHIVSVNTINNTSIEVVTDHFLSLESDLTNNEISVHHMDRLTLEEIVEYILEKEQGSKE